VGAARWRAPPGWLVVPAGQSDRRLGVGVDGSSGSFAEEVALGRETCTPGSSSAADSVVVGDGAGVGVYVGGVGSAGGGVGVGGVGAGGLRP
jgi:hypothetical protein